MGRFTKMLVAILLLQVSCNLKSKEQYQLVIVNGSLFNTNTLKIEKNKSIFINNGLISKITETTPEDRFFENVIIANDKVLTPSFIDVHNHLNFIFGDTIEITDPEKFQSAREQLTREYMPYGVTVVRSAGGRESHIPMEQSWMESNANYVDYYPTGGALVSLNTHFYNHTFVPDSAAVVSKIKTYHQMGIGQIKAYSLMGDSQLKAAIETANTLNMNIFGHIENSLISIETASELGLINFEHAKTLFLEAIRTYEASGQDLTSLPPDDNENWRYREYEVFNLLGSQDSLLLSLVERFKKHKMSLTPTLHIYAQCIGLTNDKIQYPLHEDDQLNWSGVKLARAQMGYKVLASLVNTLHENGVVLNTGSDTYEPGKTILSEMLLLHELGISMAEVLKIASLNSAQSMQLSNQYGSIEVGKKAHLLLFEKNPLTDPINLLSKKTVIKDGVVWE